MELLEQLREGTERKLLKSNYMKKKPGLYANIHKKRKSGKPMRKKGEKGAPTDKAFKQAAKKRKK